MNEIRIMFSIRLLGLLCLCIVLPHLAPAQAAADAGPCVASCGVSSFDCEKQRRVGLVCADTHRVCVERCDPHRISKGSVLALYPPEGRLVGGPRLLMKAEDRLALCRQDCAMNVYTCRGGVNAYVGGGHASGRNEQAQCARAAAFCEQRCLRDSAGLVPTHDPAIPSGSRRRKT